MPILSFDPPILAKMLEQMPPAGRLLSIDVDLDSFGPRDIRMDIDVAFWEFGLGPPDGFDPVGRTYYLGHTGVTVGVHATGGKVTDSVTSKPLDVEYEARAITKRSTAFELKVQGAPTVTLEAGGECGFSTRFTWKEAVLSVGRQSTYVEFVFDLPRGNRATRSYLHGNLPLWARIQWPAANIKGHITVKPAGIGFFDPEKRSMGYWRTLFARYVLYANQLGVTDAHGFRINFTENV
jgi:hypothetical protein